MNWISVEENIRALISYDGETGIVTWNERPRSWFPSERAAKIWNTKFAGKVAGGKSRDYYTISFFNKRYMLHRVIWLWVHGEWPEEIDHINGDPSDNRLRNLRSVSRQENSKNLSKPATNKSGVAGVFYHRGRGKWVASIRDKGKNTLIGRFDTKAEAVEARKARERALGYHPNHGRPKQITPPGDAGDEQVEPAWTDPSEAAR